VDLPMDEAPFDASTYSKNQSRLLHREVADLSFFQTLNLARRRGCVSDDHFSAERDADRVVGLAQKFQTQSECGGLGSGNTHTSSLKKLNDDEEDKERSDEGGGNAAFIVTDADRLNPRICLRTAIAFPLTTRNPQAKIRL
jgi:hypothetical protein